MIVKLLVEGGSMSPGPALAQQLGPLGINIGQVISKVNEATSNFKGTKVPVELNVDPVTKNFEITVRSPPVAELIKKELKLETASGDHKKVKAGNISIEKVIGIAKTKLGEALESNLKSMVKTVVGTCASLGVLVDSKEAVQVASEISEGKYDKEIKEGKTEPSEEKKKELETYFEKIKKDQDAKIKLAKEQADAKEVKDDAKTKKAIEDVKKK
ncbi:50S ribosomal protein L11 [Candidatus Pacearchaeota archaeon CG10_big_fil_rev_8_21_14_0_10_30_48]|nr:MAG: 50S ribosomal protein L11 [Candidatus Pacearchaeota archaeon CG10_big_fil_rev_8_21_14_0_10_30_48]